MAGQSLVFSESIDDVLRVVQETPRGRWFVEAYAQRVKGENNNAILGAIAKLEAHVTSMANSGATNEVLQKARNAIAQAREEIAKLEPQTATLSKEAQLFSKLADMSKQAFGENQGGKGVQRALKLVADLDRDLHGESAITNSAPTATIEAKPAQQYFKQDETVFEATPAPKLVEVAPAQAKAPEAPEVSNRGAKLVIKRISPAVQPAPVSAEAEVEASAESAPPASIEEPKFEAPASEPVAIASTSEPTFEPVAITSTPEPASEIKAETSRIVIIRRKADETIAVPLVDAEAEVNAA